MGSVAELAAKIQADREALAELAGPINSSKGQAEHTLSALAALGIERSAAELRQVVDRIEEAEQLRAALDGVLVKAHWQAMSAIQGKMGPGARGSTSSVIDNSDGTVSWHGTVDGIKTQIVYGTPKEDTPDPSGQELVEEAQPRSRFGRAVQTMVKEDASDPAKFTGQTLENLSKTIRDDQASRPSSTSTESSRETNWIAEIHQPATVEIRATPAPSISGGSLFEMAAVGSIVLMKSGQSLSSSISSLKNLVKERKSDDQNR